MIRAPSPSSPTLPLGGTLPPTPPTPPTSTPLSLADIYASDSDSDAAPSFFPSSTIRTHAADHEILSDLPARQRTLDTDAYREGLSAAKGTHVQEGFDEGYTLGAELGVRVGAVLGVLAGLADAARTATRERKAEVDGMLEMARGELAIEKVLGGEWVDGEGVWRWEVEGGEGDAEVTFREVARWHPVVREWEGRVEGLVREWGVDLEAVERGREDGER